MSYIWITEGTAVQVPEKWVGLYSVHLYKSNLSGHTARVKIYCIAYIVIL